MTLEEYEKLMQDVIDLSSELRSLYNYKRTGATSWESMQTSNEIIDQVATKLERMVAKYSIPTTVKTTRQIRTLTTCTAKRREMLMNRL